MASAVDLTLPLPGPEWFQAPPARLEVVPGASLSASGRDAVLAAEAEGWSLWTPALRPVARAAVRGMRPGPGWIGAGMAGRELAGAGHSLSERWTVSLDLPLAVWEVTGTLCGEVVLEWTVDPRRASLTISDAARAPRVDVASDGSRASIVAVDAARVELVASGARLRVVSSSSGPAARIVCEGRTPVRVLVAAAADRAALGRVAQALRRAASDPIGSRQRHEAQAARAATAATTPHAPLDEAFRWATHRLDALLTPVPELGRAVLTRRGADTEPRAGDFDPSMVRAAVAQLMAGRRDPARELIRLVGSAGTPEGRVGSPRVTGGAAGSPEPFDTAFSGLVERYAAWTGDLEFLERHGITAGAALHRPSPHPAELAGFIEAARAFLSDPAVLRPEPAAAVVEAVVRGLWGVEPAAPESAVTLRPAPPAAWQATALRRLRVGRTILDLEVRRRRADLVVRVHRVFGPRILVTLAPPEAFVDAVVDDVELGPAQARFEAGDRHEVLFRGVPA